MADAHADELQSGEDSGHTENSLFTIYNRAIVIVVLSECAVVI